MTMKFGKLAAATAVALGLSGPAWAQVEVEWWDFLAGGDGVRMKALIDQFNEEHPEIQISGTTLEWGLPFYTKVRTAVAVGQGPDIMTYHLSRLPLALEEDVLSPISDADLEAAGLSKGDFFEASITAASTDDGQLMAVPFDIHAVVVHYNRTALDGTKWLDADGNLTGISSIAEMTELLTWAKGEGFSDPLSFQSEGGGGTWRMFYTLLRQQGGEMLTDGEVLVGDNMDKAVTAIQTLADWRAEGLIPEQAAYEASVALFSGGKSVLHINGVWEVPTFKDSTDDGSLGFEWFANEVPQMMDMPATWADSHAFAIPNDPDMTDEKREAVLTVIGWMQEHSLAWAGAGHIPAYKPTVESDDYAALQPNATYASLADNAAFDPRSKIAGVASPVYDAVDNLIAPAVHGFLSAEDAAEQMKAQLQALLD
ncbi:multiple sugar transport system substrate-binding protein [Mameliella alba]|uniref:extracellular solute-binding protein n=1 Tax=Mameliella alba TaxID=561184 RepID=UPI0008890FA7|nr:extracellular solute-binding protein [Mameliella alba]OWV48735.1 ABC transporter substrate-binding protein [Mameliella alba]PTR39302.1 carbohydrate ABC transporter substrate-binding protein (CUT1 family) [Mameliella alba]SDD30055.1 multiple sugar transport system substrate-binding protein [Mameliella alba]